jgi:hypothetical protein
MSRKNLNMEEDLEKRWKEQVYVTSELISLPIPTGKKRSDLIFCTR